ncbi:hypothetical protein GCM10010967_55460 [Dyadobacter beijingensis]|uniref:histidine kinase n=1 Tax=Dyadobacter beijingensis TaxID=365489 RepID=A0ABQ2ILF4_9BACT|nr:hypothetical protein GCM10010967_55460 [Dyadobacter beijingensis]
MLEIIQDNAAETGDRNDALADLANLYYNKPRKRYEDLDKAAAYARRVLNGRSTSAKTDAQQRAIKLLALVAIDKKDFRQAEKWLPRLEKSYRLDLKLRLAYAYCDADKDFKDDDWARATGLAKEAIVASIDMQDPVRETQARQIIALVHARQQDPAAEAELLDIVNRFRKAGSRYYQTTYAALSEYNYYIGDQLRSLYYSMEAIKTMKASGDSGMAADIYFNHAVVCTDNDEYAKGFNYMRLAIERYGERAGRYNLSDPLMLYTAEYIFGKAGSHERDMRLMQQLLQKAPPQTASDRVYRNLIMGCIFRRMGKHAKSEEYCKRAYDVSQKYHIHIALTTATLAQLYVESRQFAKARPLLLAEAKFPETYWTNGSKLHIHFMSFLADSATGYCYDAMRHLSACSTINNVNLKRSKEQEGQKLRMAFEAQQREDEIKIKDRDIRLLNQNVNIQQERVRNANLTMVMAVVAAIFVIIIAGLIFSKYRERTINSREIEHKNMIITEKNQILEHLLTEKEWLLKEVHHRVKNNLHTIICLLESQASYLGNEALKALETSQNRIYAMSLIHQKLYQSEDIKTVDMRSYFTEFLHFLSDTFGTSKEIRVIQEIDPIKLPTGLAIPLALIVNESVTNAYKYAFPGKTKGLIHVSLHERDGRLSLIVEDNGIGWDESSYNSQSSLGIQLIKGLSEDLGARVLFESRGGTRISLALQYEADRWVGLVVRPLSL